MDRTFLSDDSVSDSQIPNSSFSLSLPSEPPDIRNWYPSYQYESFVLDTYDDFGGSFFKESELGCEKDGLAGVEERNREKERRRNGSNSDENKHENQSSLKQIPDSPESSCFLSELPDIRNWFPSYVYESPVVDESVRFLPDETECKEDELANQDCKILKEINIKKFGHNRANEKKNSNRFFKSNSSFGDDEKEIQSLDKGTGVVEKGDWSIWENLRHEMKHGVEDKSFPNHGIIQAKDVQRSSFNYENLSCKKQQKENVAHEDGFVSVKCNIKSISNEGNSATTLIYRKDLTENLEAESQEVDLVSPGGNVKVIQVAGASSKRESTYTRSDDKENEVQKLENGFVRTRKNRVARPNDENAPGRPQQIPQECSINGGMMTSTNGEKDVIVKRTVLSEVSNFGNVAQEDGFASVKCNMKSISNEGNSATTLIYSEDLTENLEAESQEVDLVFPGGNVKVIQVAGASSKRESTYTRNDDKENEVQNLGNGFVRTRKNRIARPNDENAPGRPQQILQECSINGGIMISRDGEKDVIVKRRVLSEVSNFGNLDVVGVTGRWQRPQKRKPNRGPPMKQLRLEQWVRRLQKLPMEDTGKSLQP